MPVNWTINMEGEVLLAAVFQPSLIFVHIVTSKSVKIRLMAIISSYRSALKWRRLGH